MAPDLWLYFLTVLAVILLPGMDMAYVMASSLSAAHATAQTQSDVVPVSCSSIYRRAWTAP